MSGNQPNRLDDVDYELELQRQPQPNQPHQPLQPLDSFYLAEKPNNDAPDDDSFEGSEEVQARFVHPGAANCFKAVPCARYFPLFGRVCESFGPKLTLSLGLCYLLSKGAGGNIINVSRQPMFMVGYGIDTIRYQRLATMYSLGWSVKAFVAVITDIFPAFGYTKRWYMVLSAIAGSAFALAYALLPMKESSANSAAAFVFLTCFGKANIDILSEGHYTRLMRDTPQVGTAVVSWVWAMTFAGTVISACIMGPLADKKLTYVGVIISAGLQFITMFFFIFNMYDERKNRVERRVDAQIAYEEAQRKLLEKKQSELDMKQYETRPEREPLVDDYDQLDGKPQLALTESPHGEEEEQEQEEELVEPNIGTCVFGIFEINKDVARKNWRLVAYSVTMACAVVTLACVTVLGTMWHRLYTVIAVTVVLGVGAFLALPLVIAKAAVFLFLNSVLYIQIPGALKSFYLATAKCYPGGPNFSYTFYTTIAALITNVFGVVGAVLFTTFFSKHRFAWVFVATTILQMLASIFDLIIVKRWNRPHVSDHAMYILGDAIVYEVCFVMSMMPTQILMSRLCPRGTESMSFALLAGISNAGTSMSSVIGSLLMEFVWPVSTRPCNFTNLPNLIITCHLTVPILTVPLAFLLLPNAKINEAIDRNGKPIKKKEEEKAADCADSDGSSTNNNSTPYPKQVSGLVLATDEKKESETGDEDNKKEKNADERAFPQ